MRRDRAPVGPRKPEARHAREHGGGRRRVWRKVHLAMDASPLAVRALEIADGGVGDSEGPARHRSEGGPERYHRRSRAETETDCMKRLGQTPMPVRQRPRTDGGSMPRLRPPNRRDPNPHRHPQPPHRARNPGHAPHRPIPPRESETSACTGFAQQSRPHQPVFGKGWAVHVNSRRGHRMIAQAARKPNASHGPKASGALRSWREAIT